MKLRATITIDFEALDFRDAGQKQQKLDELAQELAKQYDEVTFDIRERRDFKKSHRPNRKPEN